MYLPIPEEKRFGKVRKRKTEKPSEPDGAKELTEALQSLKGDRTPAPTEQWRTFQNLRPEFDKSFKDGE